MLFGDVSFGHFEDLDAIILPNLDRDDAAPIACYYAAMARRIDRVRTGRDRVTDYLEKYGDRLNPGAVRDGDSLGWVVDTLE